MEEQFRWIILSGEIEQFFDRFDNGDYSKDDVRKNEVWCEAYLQYCLEEMFETEVDAYHHLSEYQRGEHPGVLLRCEASGWPWNGPSQ